MKSYNLGDLLNINMHSIVRAIKTTQSQREKGNIKTLSNLIHTMQHTLPISGTIQSLEFCPWVNTELQLSPIISRFASVVLLLIKPDHHSSKQCCKSGDDWIYHWQLARQSEVTRAELLCMSTRDTKKVPLAVVLIFVAALLWRKGGIGCGDVQWHNKQC